jgi:hypothetical protein
MLFIGAFPAPAVLINVFVGTAENTNHPYKYIYKGGWATVYRDSFPSRPYREHQESPLLCSVHAVSSRTRPSPRPRHASPPSCRSSCPRARTRAPLPRRGGPAQPRARPRAHGRHVRGLGWSLLPPLPPGPSPSPGLLACM